MKILLAPVVVVLTMIQQMFLKQYIRRYSESTYIED